MSESSRGRAWSLVRRGSGKSTAVSSTDDATVESDSIFLCASPELCRRRAITECHGDTGSNLSTARGTAVQRRQLILSDKRGGGRGAVRRISLQLEATDAIVYRNEGRSFRFVDGLEGNVSPVCHATGDESVARCRRELVVGRSRRKRCHVL